MLGRRTGYSNTVAPWLQITAGASSAVSIKEAERAALHPVGYDTSWTQTGGMRQSK